MSFKDKYSYNSINRVIVTELVSCIMQVPSSSSHIARCFKARHECFFVRREGGIPCRCGSNGNATIGTR